MSKTVRSTLIPSLVAILLAPMPSLPAEAEAAQPAPATALAADTDGDGIPDDIERQDWYVAAGGSVDRKDVWVECDTMRRIDPSRNWVQRTAAEVFDRAPVANPSGERGIALHVAFDDRIRFRELLGDGSFEGLYAAAMEQRAQGLNAAPFRGQNAATMMPFFHYCLYVNAINEQGTSGISFDSTDPGGGIPGDTFIVSIGGLYRVFDSRDPETLRWETGTFLHELGHNLGLTHGGSAPARHTTFKPHYLSVMNYHFQQGFVRIDEEGHLVRASHWDYSRFGTDNRVNERRLSERRGVQAPAARATDVEGNRYVGLFRGCSPSWLIWFDWNEAIDFNCNGTIDAEPVQTDTNNDGMLQNLGKVWNDWANLAFDGVTGAARRTPREALLPSEELTLEQAEQLRREMLDARPPRPER